MADLPFPLSGVTLVVGPSNAGKTRLTARALDAWVAAHGPDGVVVFDFAPVVERDGRVLGGRLTQFTTPPDGAWYGVLDAHAPRADSDDEAGATRLAADNAARATTLFDAAPAEPTAVFVNDATIPFQHSSGDRSRFFDYCSSAKTVVCNAFESDALGVDDAVSRTEQRTLAALRRWADRTAALG
ncbi:hypothetical protein SAMN04487949_3577 [Halogranum gelatinilyticum]|uniref:Uncharacterized protein n=1 Tax=Halogranum gelatinilyticum TaxID=660521 RepID=A0A1G9ZBJ1_9EURY|nr:hypothetical protein [Halogranum gelatinilyticum]SDN18261.1 hypothetical protein SAMN04487949_3577 [Halogranum gelatinilyticum]